MSTGPLRRLVGTAGLVLLAPTALLLLTGSITPVDAAVRALATLAGTLVVGRIATRWLDHLASSFEREQDGEQPDDDASQRREADR